MNGFITIIICFSIQLLPNLSSYSGVVYKHRVHGFCGLVVDKEVLRGAGRQLFLREVVTIVRIIPGLVPAYQNSALGVCGRRHTIVGEVRAKESLMGLEAAIWGYHGTGEADSQNLEWSGRVQQRCRSEDVGVGASALDNLANRCRGVVNLPPSPARRCCRSGLVERRLSSAQEFGVPHGRR